MPIQASWPPSSGPGGRGGLLTFLRSSAASSRFCSPSREVSFLLGGEESTGLSGDRSEGDLRMTSKLWPEALLSSCFTSMSVRPDGDFRMLRGPVPSTHPSQGLGEGARLLTWDTPRTTAPVRASLSGSQLGERVGEGGWRGHGAREQGKEEAGTGPAGPVSGPGHTHPHTGRWCWGAAVSRNRSR